MYVTRAEKDLFLENAITEGTIEHLREVLGENAFPSGLDKRALTYAKNTLDEVNINILEKMDSQKDRDSFIRNLTNSLDLSKTKTKLTHFYDEENVDEEIANFFGNFCVVYSGIRDCLNYYKENPEKLPKNTLTKLKSSRTQFRKMFKRYIEDAELDWEYLIEPYETKEDKYDYEAKMIVC